MKIQRIEIHNVASIENATIDFAAGPLADENLFLICGETGSGKTTLLNSITLALYNSTPALLAYGNNDKDANGVTTKNASQMLRRGAADGFINLDFIANDGVAYRAVWTARKVRTRDKSLRVEVKTRIERQSDGAKAETAVEELTGLTFKQFTQTTILAQGQFTKFLLADESEKAEILEKLTGTEIYASIGKRIYDTKCEKETQLKSLNDRIAGAKLLSDDEKRALTEEIPELNGSILRRAKELKEIDSKLKWLADADAIEKRLSDTDLRLAKANAALEADEHRQAINTVSLWDETAAPRAAMAEISQLKKDRDASEKAKVKLGERYSKILGGLIWLKENTDAMQAKAVALDAKIEAEKGNEPMYAKAEAIVLLAKTAEDESKDAAEHKKKADGLAKKLDEATARLDGAKAKAQSAEERYQKAEEESKQREDEAKRYDIKQISEAVDGLRSQSDALQRAATAYDKYLESKTRKEHAEKEFADIAAEIHRLHDEIKGVKAKLPELEGASKEKKCYLEGMMELNDHIVSLRQRFAQTHECPLCGAKVVGLAADESIADKLAEAKEHADSAQKAYEEATASLAKAEAELMATAKNFRKKGSDVEKTTEEESKAREDAQKAAKAIGLDIDDEKFAAAISELSIELEAKKGKENEKLLAAINAGKAYDAARKACEDSRKSCDEANREVEDILKLISNTNLKIEAEQMLEKKAAEAIASALGQIKAVIGDDCDVTLANCRALGAKIAEGAEKYAANKQSLADARQKISEAKGLISNVEGPVSQLANAFTDAKAAHPAEIPNLSAAIADLIVKVSVVDGRIQSYSESIASKQREVDEYIASPNGHSLEEIQKVQAYSDEYIAELEKKIKAADDELIAAKSACEEILRQKKLHLEVKPEIAETETTESLSLLREESEKQREASTSRLAEVNALLKNDEVRSAELEQTKAQRDAMKEECARWAELEGLYGGAKGQKFRLMAQSYVLRTLLQKANHYLKDLSQRYELYCTDNSLVINVIDHDQNESARAVNLLSGGESFIVSLALALGLASISKERLHVDTLFIDEGFGSLDAATLETVITTLNRLHIIGGRRVGIISHVVSLAERIPAQIRMKRTGPGKSEALVYSL